MDKQFLNSRPWTLIPHWINSTQTSAWFDYIYTELNWSQPLVRVYGSEFKIPRKAVFIADKGITYRYSGYLHTPLDWPNWFIPLLKKVRQSCSVQFNGCLLNLYRNGNDRMGWHSDNEPELDPTKAIASLSLGSTRDFRLKHRYRKEIVSLSLRDGDLLVMSPYCQKEWIHSLPPRKKIVHPRINLTFRCYRKPLSGAFSIS